MVPVGFATLAQGPRASRRPSADASSARRAREGGQAAGSRANWHSAAARCDSVWADTIYPLRLHDALFDRNAGSVSAIPVRRGLPRIVRPGVAQLADAEIFGR